MLTIDHSQLQKSLGFHRSRLLSCLGADLADPPPIFGDDPLTIYRVYVQNLSVEWGAATDRATVSLLAAARLLYGDLHAAHVLIDHFPQRPIRADHDARVCLLAPLYALQAALPIPEALRDTSSWLAGSPQQASLRSWLGRHSANLHWNRPAGIYEFR